MRPLHCHRIIFGSVSGAALLPLAKENGAKLVILNRERTDFDGLADLAVHAEIDNILEPSDPNLLKRATGESSPSSRSKHLRGPT